MRAALIFALLLAGCNREPSFDQRYAAVEQQLKAKAVQIDREVENRAHGQGPRQPAPTPPKDDTGRRGH